MNSRTIRKYGLLPLLAAAVLCTAGCTKNEPSGGGTGRGGSFRLSAVAESMSPENVVTRAADPKDEAEREIKELHVFLFGPDRKYLQARQDGEEHPFQGYKTVTGSSSLLIDNEGFADAGAASQATVYVVANVEPGTFGNLTPEGYPEKIPDQDAFEAFYYEPVSYETLVALPAWGMPMAGKSNTTVDLTQSRGEVVIEMKALMARIDFSFKISSPDGEIGNLPRLNLTDYKICNMATAVPLIAPAAGSQSKLDWDGDGTAEKTTEREGIMDPTANSVIYNQSGETTLSFYVFENLRQPGYDTYPAPYPYPEGTAPEAEQCYKPMLAENGKGEKIPATHLIIEGMYTDIDGLNYNATCTIYLGNDPKDDFNIERNHLYRNRVTISGIARTNDHPVNSVTFDARINVETTNPYYISLLRHKNLDAHFNVIPMDVYLFDKTKRPSMKIEVKDPEANTWVRIERVPASVMESGVAEDYQNSNPGQAFAAGTGIRKYFTRNLLTDPAQLANSTGYDGLANRDRIYLYVDENISTKDRTADLVLTYKENEQPVGEPYIITLEQHGLLKVSVLDDNDRHSYYVYAEAYEEYLNYYDPLSSWQSDQVYDGLPWGLVSTEVGGSIFSFLPTYDAIRGYYDGQKHTIAILTKQGIYGQDRSGNPTAPLRPMVMDEKPASAAEYCYRKNKTDADGTIHYDRMNWFLPTIREQERVVKTYYASTPDFQNFFYWSSNVADGTEGLEWPFTREATSYARATKAKLENGTIGHIESGRNQYYDENLGSASTGGKAHRNTVLRIRAIYRPKDDVPIE